MFNPKYRILLSNECFPPDAVVCLGSQLIAVVNCIKDWLPSHLWFGADVEATGPGSIQYNRHGIRLWAVGSDQKFIEDCAVIDQFIWGVFLCVSVEYAHQTECVELETEDKQFRPIELNGVLLEIRAFDTTFFEIFTEDLDLATRMAEVYDVPVESTETNEDTMRTKPNKFDYGESIRIFKSAPEKYQPTELGFICGMIEIDSTEAAEAYDCVGSDWLYTVEFLSGASLQIPEKYLEKDAH